MHKALTEMQERATQDVYCGFIKAKFAIEENGYLADEPYSWVSREFEHARRTDHFLYVQIGHSEISSNEQARTLIRAIEEHAGKITRLDFTIDIMQLFNYRGWYDGKRKEYESAPNKTGLPKPSLITSVDGDTVYIGKRSSARMLRVYDKRAEILAKTGVDIEFDIMRVELEVKRGLVKTYKALFLSGNTRAILADIAARYGLPWLCEHHRKLKPYKVTRATEGPMAWVRRYRRVIRQAWLEDSEEFLDIIGVTYDEGT